MVILCDVFIRFLVRRLPMNKKILLNVSGLKKTYTLPKKNFFDKASTIEALKGVSFDIYEGETFGLVGESGCGKSTIANIVSGLLKASEGSILFNERSMALDAKRWPKEERKEIQMVFQDPYSSLNPRKKIGWLLEEPLKIHTRFSSTQRRERVIEMLEEIGFDASFYERFPHELSGGQRQRICIGIALITTPKLLIADEPVSALDVSVQASVLNLLKDLQKKYNSTCLFISHDLSVVEYMSDRIGVMKQGEMVELAEVDQLYQHPKHPYTKMLIESIPTL